MDFIELKVAVQPDYADIIVAELAETGFDSFVDTSQGVNAYIRASLFDELQVQEIVNKYRVLTSISYSFSTLKQQNWNEEWEKNYSPIYISDQCIVRASFHAIERSYPYEIVINPKMSFGTGHHETTSLMLEMQLNIDHQRKRVIDVGCGTGILAIMACKRGAAVVDAFDIDTWAVENAQENCELNNCSTIKVQQGTISEVTLSGQYEIILANINRNILLQELPKYTEWLAPDGLLLLSGFYEQDIAELQKIAVESHLSLVAQKIKQQWATLCFQK